MAINKKVSLGRIGFVIEGDFDSTKAYKKLSVVKVPSTGSVYVAREDIPANTAITDSRWYKFLDGNTESSGIFISSAEFDESETGNVASVSTTLTKYNVIINILNDWKDGIRYYDDYERLYVYNQRHNKYIKINLIYDNYLENNIIICEVDEVNNTSKAIVIPVNKLNKLEDKLKGDLNEAVEHINDNMDADRKNTRAALVSVNNSINNIKGIINKNSLFITKIDNSVSALNLYLPEGYTLDFDGNLVFKCIKHGLKTIYIRKADSGFIKLELNEPLYEGNVYVIYKYFSNDEYRINLLYEDIKVINSPAYISKIGDNEPNSLMINAVSNIQNIYSNYQYNFDCVNNESELDLFSFLANKVNNSLQNITAINVNNYNALYLKVRLRMIFHIANYYKHFDVRGGNYKTASNSGSGMTGVGSYFSGNATYPKEPLGEGVLNDIPVCIPQFYNYENLELTRLRIPVNSKFTIVLLPNLNPVNGEVVLSNVAQCPYSINIWFDNFASIVNYNNGIIGQMVTITPEQALVPDEVIEKYIDINPQISSVTINE